MTVQQYIQKGHKWMDMKGVPVRCFDERKNVFIHNKFFEGKELQFQNELIAFLMKNCPKRVWCWRVYGGDTPDANMVQWIETQVFEIVKTVDAVRDYLEREGATTDKDCTQYIHGWHSSKTFILKARRIFGLKYTYEEKTGEFTLFGFEN